MIISFGLLLLSLLLDGIISNYLPFLMNQLSYFTPLLSLTSLLFLYPMFQKKEKRYYVVAFLFGVLYDLLYTNLLVYDGLVFLLFAFLVVKLHQTVPTFFLFQLLYLVVFLLLYESMRAIFFCLIQQIPLTWNDLWYKITHSMILNICYGSVLYFVVKMSFKLRKEVYS